MLMVRVFPKCTVQNENAIVQTADFISVHVRTFGTSGGKMPGKIVILSNHTKETDEKCNILVKSLCFLPEKLQILLEMSYNLYISHCGFAAFL